MILKIKGILRRIFIGNNDRELTMSYDGVMRYVPLFICGGFFIATIFVFAFGPLDWHVTNPFKLYLFLSACSIALILGYMLAVKKGKTANRVMNLNINNILLICIIVYFIIYIPTLIATTGKWYPDIITGIFDTGKAYNMSHYYSQFGSKMLFYIRIVLAPFLIMIMPITLFFMPKLSKIVKILGIITIILTVCMSISQGVNKYVADFTAQIVLFLAMKFFSNTVKGSKILFRIKIIFLILLVSFSFLAYYSNAMKNRTNTSMTKDENGEYDYTVKYEDKDLYKLVEVVSTFNQSTLKEDYFLNKILPTKITSMTTYLSSYITHGYKGLSYSLDKDFTSSYGLGFSEFFRRNVLKVINQADMENQILERTYEYKLLENGWITGAIWSTFFIFPASDISFPGTVLLVFLIGFLFGLSWKDSLLTQNPFAIASFFGFCTMIFYFSANNQMFQSGETFVGFTTVLICWGISRKILKKNSNKL